MFPLCSLNSFVFCGNYIIIIGLLLCLIASLFQCLLETCLVFSNDLSCTPYVILVSFLFPLRKIASVTGAAQLHPEFDRQYFVANLTGTHISSHIKINICKQPCYPFTIPLTIIDFYCFTLVSRHRPSNLNYVNPP